MALNENQLLISSSNYTILKDSIEIGQVLSLYKETDNLSKTSQSSMRQVFGSLAGTDSGMFVGVDVNTCEVYQIKNADKNYKANPFMMFDRVPL